MTWLRRYYSPILTILTSIIVGILLLMTIGQTTANGKQLEATQRGVVAFKEDNAQQTVILCTLILSNNLNLSDTDVAHIETICRQKVSQASTTTSTSQPAPPKAQALDNSKNTSQNSTQNTQSNQNTTGSQDNQADSPQPGLVEQGLQMVNRGVLQPIGGFVKGVL